MKANETSTKRRTAGGRFAANRPAGAEAEETGTKRRTAGGRFAANRPAGVKAEETSTKRRPMTATRIDQALMKLLESWDGDKASVPNVTVSDFVRLLQIQKELKAEKRPKEIKVTWMEPEEKP